MKRSNLELQFEALLNDNHLKLLDNDYEIEYKFCDTRRWRFDFAWPDPQVAVEIEGGAWLGKGHTGGKKFQLDMEKYNAAVLLGWKVLRYSGDTMGNAIEDLKKLL